MRDFFQEIGGPYRKILAVAVGLMLGIGALGYFEAHIKPEVIHPDEVVRVRMARYFKLFFLDHDLQDPQWHKREIYLGPPYSAYIAGAALWLGGARDRIGAHDIDGWWDFKRSFSWNLTHISLPSTKELYALKFAMAVFVSLSCLVLYGICFRCYGGRTAFFATLLFASHPLTLECATKATMDAPLVFLILAGVMTTVCFFESMVQGRLLKSAFYAAGTGCAVGIAAGTKIQGAIAGLFFLAVCAGVLLTNMVAVRMNKGPEGSRGFSRKKQALAVAGCIFLMTTVAIVFFVAVNPTLYRRPLEGVHKMLTLRAEQIHIQIREFSSPHGVDREYSTEVLNDLFAKTRNAWRRVLGEGAEAFLVFFLLSLGFVSAVCVEIKRWSKGMACSAGAIPLLWLVLFGTVMVPTIYIDFPRHYFALIPPVCVLAGHGLTVGLRQCDHWFVWIAALPARRGSK